jgi:hypothetical protein
MEQKLETVRWHLECIPEELDKFVRHRQIEERKKYICQQVVADLYAYYKILQEREENDTIK